MHTVKSVVICRLVETGYLIRVKGADEHGRNEHTATIRKGIRPVVWQ